MAIYRFRVELEDHEGILREIEIKSTQTFDDLHLAILNAFAFDTKHPAAFFYSDDLWHMDEELVYKDLPFRPFNNPTPMNRAKIADYIDDPHQRYVFLYDYEEGWTFLVELINIDPSVGAATGYPKLVKTAGDSPKQYIIKTFSKNSKDEITKISALDEEEEEDLPLSDVGDLFGSLEVGSGEKDKVSFDLIDDEFEADKEDELDTDEDDDDLDGLDDFNDDMDDDSFERPSNRKQSNYDEDY